MGGQFQLKFNRRWKWEVDHIEIIWILRTNGEMGEGLYFWSS
jgi:hypothetical protein